MVDPRQPWRPTGGPILMFALLLLVIALLVGWVYLRNPSQVSSPTAAGAPATGAPTTR